MTGEFDPAAHHDRYRDQLEDLVRRKATGHPATRHRHGPHQPRSQPQPSLQTPPTTQTPLTPQASSSYTDVTDLTNLLRASLATAR